MSCACEKCAGEEHREREGQEEEEVRVWPVAVAKR